MLVLLIAASWYLAIQQERIIEQMVIATYQQTELEIVRASARSIQAYVKSRLDQEGQIEIADLEQEIFERFIAPIRLLQNGDAWIYAPDHVVYDRSADFPDEYRGKSMAEIFAIQIEQGASHYQDMTQAVMAAREGVGWYIWLPDKGKEIAAWTPIRVQNYVWTIGLSTPLPEILESVGVQTWLYTVRVGAGTGTVLILGFLAVWFRYLTARRSATRLLQERETRYRTLFESAQDAIIVLQDGRLVDCNHQALKMFGCTHDQFFERTPFDFCPDIQPDGQRSPVVAEIRIQAALHGEPQSFEWLACKYDGTAMYLDISLTRMELPNAPCVLIVARDVTERKQAADEISRLETFNQSIVSQMLEGIVIEDAQGRIVFVNPAAAKMLGYQAEEMPGMHWTQIIDPSHHSLIEKINQGRKRGESNLYEVELVRKDGSTFPALTSGGPRFEQAQFVGTLAVFTDITGQKQAREAQAQLQERLARAQRMESLGILAGGVAHELNNILGPLVGYPDLILSDLPSDSPVRQDIIQMQQSAERAAAVVRDLLTLAQRGTHQMMTLSLNTVIQDYLNDLSFGELQACYPLVSLTRQLQAHLNVRGSHPHLSQVVRNLVINAFEAIPHGGQVTLSTADISLDRPIEGYMRIEAGDYMLLQVADTGVGIEAKDMGHLFEPFYTKKVMGHSGTGLGLSIVHGVVRDHNGFIDVQTQVGQGTTFSVYLPATPDTAIDAPTEPNDYRGSETVLVVDDLEEQRQLATRLLTSLGYQVHAVENGRAALRHLETHAADILVLDMIMEDDLDGLDAFREIVKLRPGQKAIIASGFSETERVKETQRLGAGRFVKKPYTLLDLGKAVREELDRS